MSGRVSWEALPELVPAAVVAERYGCSVRTLQRRVEAGVFPAPATPMGGGRLRWRADVVDAFERGEWSPPADGGGRVVGLRGVS